MISSGSFRLMVTVIARAARTAIRQAAPPSPSVCLPDGCSFARKAQVARWIKTPRGSAARGGFCVCGYSFRSAGLRGEHTALPPMRRQRQVRAIIPCFHAARQPISSKTVKKAMMRYQAAMPALTNASEAGGDGMLSAGGRALFFSLISLTNSTMPHTVPTVKSART